MAEYIKRDDAIKAAERAYDAWNLAMATADSRREINLVYKRQELCKAVASVFDSAPTADVAPVTRYKNCKHSTLPSELTQRYGKQGTLTCHNMHAPSNRRNVGGDDFCSYGEPKEVSP